MSKMNWLEAVFETAPGRCHSSPYKETDNEVHITSSQTIPTS
jgi:hypothetical protein